MVTAPSVSNYSIGKGLLEICTFVGGTYSPIGNCSSVTVEHKIDRLEHFSSMEGIKVRDAYPVTQIGYTLTFETDEICAENLVRWSLGTQSGSSISALQSVDEDFKFRFTENKEIGENRVYEFSKVKLSPNGAGALVSEEWGVLSFTAEGLYDASNVGKEWYEIRWTSTTTS